MLTGHPDETAEHSVTLPPLHKVPFQACFHAYVFNVWTARGTYLVPEYCKPGGFLDTSAPHLSGEQSYGLYYLRQGKVTTSSLGTRNCDEDQL